MNVEVACVSWQPLFLLRFVCIVRQGTAFQAEGGMRDQPGAPPPYSEAGGLKQQNSPLISEYGSVRK